MVDHRATQICPGHRAHEGPVVDYRKPADTAVDHHDCGSGELVARSDCRCVARDQGVDDTLGEGAAALEKRFEGIGESAASRGHVVEARQHGAYQVVLGQ